LQRSPNADTKTDNMRACSRHVQQRADAEAHQMFSLRIARFLTLSLSLSLLPIFTHVGPATFIFARRAPHAAENSQDGLLIVRCHLHQGYRSLTCKLCDTSKCNERSRRRDRRSMCEETIYFHGLLHIALHGTVRLPLRYPQQFGDVLQRCLGKCSRLNYTSA
jgi:hypothetical protein